MWFFTKSRQDNTVVASSKQEEDSSEFDPALLEQLGEKWLGDSMTELDPEVRRILWEAIEACRQNGKEK